ncbi:MAG: hypothetical protein ACI8YQ_000387 [Polaribacter sp.]|jgi:hypothetical protein
MKFYVFLSLLVAFSIHNSFKDEFKIEDLSINFTTTSIKQEDEMKKSLIAISAIENRLLNKFTLVIGYDNCPIKE